MRGKASLVLGLALVVAVAFGLGYRVGADQALHLPTYTADRGLVGDHHASLAVGDTAFGLDGPVSWTDDQGTLHDDSWPECLKPGQETKGVRFAGAILWHGDIGQPTIVWVDCRSNS